MCVTISISTFVKKRVMNGFFCDILNLQKMARSSALTSGVGNCVGQALSQKTAELAPAYCI